MNCVLGPWAESSSHVEMLAFLQLKLNVQTSAKQLSGIAPPFFKLLFLALLGLKFNRDCAVECFHFL
jgi:hypothetical protein